MTAREWKLFKLGIPKEKHYLVVNDWQLRMLEGPESAVAFAFDLHGEKYKFTVQWLVKEFHYFKVKTPTQLYEWSQFMLAIHPIYKYHVPLEHAGKIKELKQCLALSLQDERKSLTSKSKSRRKI